MIECSCEEVCFRWGKNSDGSGGFFCPRNPYDDTKCKQLLYGNMRPTIMHKDTVDNDK